MSIQDIEVVKAFLTDKFKENFDLVKTNARDCYYISDNYKFVLRASFIENVNTFKDDIISRLNSAFMNSDIEKGKNYMMQRAVNGSFVVLPYYEIEV